MVRGTPTSVADSQRMDKEFLEGQTLKWIAAVLGRSVVGRGEKLSGVLGSGVVLRELGETLKARKDGRVLTPTGKASVKQRQPYHAIADIDSFLSVCREFGMQDHELFSTSAVTEDPSKVCRTVWNLSKRCEARGLRLPAFATEKQEQEARRKSMSQDATFSKVDNFGQSPLKAKDKDPQVSGDKGNSGGFDWKQLLYIPIAATFAAFVAHRGKGYKVKPGDTLTQVARKLYKGQDVGKSLDKLVRENNIKNRNLILPDQVIK